MIHDALKKAKSESVTQQPMNQPVKHAEIKRVQTEQPVLQKNNSKAESQDRAVPNYVIQKPGQTSL
jgi:hypothetical protein